MYSKTSRGVLHRILKMLCCCQFCFPAARKEGFNQTRVPGLSGKSCNTFEKWAMPAWLGTADSTPKAFKMYFITPAVANKSLLMWSVLMNNDMKVASGSFFKKWPRPGCPVVFNSFCVRETHKKKVMKQLYINHFGQDFDLLILEWLHTYIYEFVCVTFIFQQYSN